MQPKTKGMLGLLLFLAALQILPANETPEGDVDPGGPAGNRWHLTSVAWIAHHLTTFVYEEQPVALVGKVTRAYGHFIYIFNDGTGHIELYSEISLPVGEAIVIRGAMDEDTINVSSWRPVGKIGDYRK